jgi:hypothetical protein
VETRQLLIMQRNALVEAMTPESEDWACVRAVRMIARIDIRLRDTDLGLEACRGMFGDNGWAPKIEGICRDLIYRPSPELVAMLARRAAPALAVAA